MASSRKDIKRITDREIEKVNIATLADRPTSGSRYGVGDLTAQMLKERFDAFPTLVKDRFNAIVDALSSADAAKYITLDGSIAGVDNLFDFLLLFSAKNAENGNISDYIEALYTKISETDVKSTSLQDIINDMSAWIVKIKEAVSSQGTRLGEAEKRLDKNDDRLESIEDYINDMYTVESSVDYHKLVPKNSRSKAKVLSVGGMTYKDGDTLKNAKTTAIKSKGANLIPFPYRGTMGAGYTTTNNGITFTVLDDGRVIANGTATANASFSISRNFALPKGVVKISGGVTVDGVKSKAYVVVTSILNGSWVAETTSIGTGKFDLTAYEYDSNDIFLLVLNGTTLNNAIFEPMVSFYQESTLPYKPYKAEPLDTISIPVSVQALDGYGWGISEEFYNEVDLDKKQFIKRVSKIVLNGTESWIYDAVNKRLRFQGISAMPVCGNKVAKSICDVFNFNEKVYFDSDRTDGICNSSETIFIRDSRFSNADDLKAFLSENPATFIYVLKEPIITDISSLFTADNEIKVSEGGYLEFENEYQYPVPNSVEWKIESSHKVAFEHANTVGNPHGTTAEEVGAISREEAERDFVHLVDGKIPSSILPSYVDDVLEYDSRDAFPTVGESGKIYVDTSKNKSHRWSGTGYVELTSSALILGTTSETAFRGDLGQAAYEHSQTKGNPHGTTMEDIIPVTEADNGKFLMVKDGTWQAVTIATAEGGGF